MVTLHEVITFLVSMQISISSLQTHNVNRCGRSEERFSRNAETDLVCRLLLEKKNHRLVDGNADAWDGAVEIAGWRLEVGPGGERLRPRTGELDNAVLLG